jgi:hypothetical protein
MRGNEFGITITEKYYDRTIKRIKYLKVGVGIYKIINEKLHHD